MAQKGLGQNEAADFAAFMGNAGSLLVFWLEPLDTGPICRQHTEMVPRDLATSQDQLRHLYHSRI
ncbi:MAG: hypothetical protein CMH66_09485 [Nioella sp.]|nr:hypothetical protein [Nioella sp.]